MQQRNAMYEQACDQLLEKVDLELPEGLTGRQASRGLNRQRLELLLQGVDEQEVERRVAELRGKSESEARRQLKRFFILAQAAKMLDVDVSEAEVNGQVATLARQRGQRLERLRQQMQGSGELEHLYLQIREQKTLDMILEKATIVTDGPSADPPAADET